MCSSDLPTVIETPGLADCLIVVGAIQPNALTAFDRHGLHYVFLANHLMSGEPPPRSSYVRYDDEAGCYEATKYLAQLGHAHIWYIGDAARPWNRNRYRGYVRATAELGLEAHVHTIALSDDEFENGQAAVSHILDEQWPVTAILAASDELAYGAREGLRQHRREVPRDVSLIGFEHRVGHPRGSNLTGVCVDMTEVGRQLAKLAIAKMDPAGEPQRTFVAPTVFVKRSTCRPLRREEHMLL